MNVIAAIKQWLGFKEDEGPDVVEFKGDCSACDQPTDVQIGQLRLCSSCISYLQETQIGGGEILFSRIEIYCRNQQKMRRRIGELNR